MEVAVAAPVGAGEKVGEEGLHVVGIESGRLGPVDDEEILCQRQLPLAEDRRGLREQFGRPIRPLPRKVAFAADSQQQRMDARGIDGMDARHAGQDRGDHGAGELVDEPAKERVFLRRPADYGDRPDRPLAVPDVINAEQRKLMPPGVVAEVVAERSLRLGGSGVHRALDHEVGVGVDRWSAATGNHRDAMAGQRAGKREFGKALGKRHHRRHGHGR